GPAYVYDRESTSPTRWPAYFDGVPIFYEWTRDALFEFRLDRRGRFEEIRPLLPSLSIQNPIDMEFGPDGSLYVLEYGDGYFSENLEAQLSRIDFVQGNFTPIPVVTSDRTVGLAPLTVQLSSAGTSDPDGDELTLGWDLDANGSIDTTEPNPVVTYEQNGSYTPVLRVADSTGRTATAAARITVGNVPPVVQFVTPTFGDPFEFGQRVNYEVALSDNEPVDCNRLTVTYYLGHDQHGHSQSTAAGCTGSFETPLDAGHIGAEVLGAVFVASYTDAPSDPTIPPLTTEVAVVLLPTPPPAPVPGPEPEPAPTPEPEPAPAASP
ncbi:MAG TPA: PKD domain-containing protein, partial [Polyangiaceae bacterium]|nr:PKD domain-containing protein [Polyangiaceae bacterium]